MRIEPAHTTLKFAALIIAGALALGISLALGSMMLSPREVLHALFKQSDSVASLIVCKLRLPRIAMAMIVGASLSVSGVMFQSLMRNPLADPYTVGVSGGAAIGATIAIVLSLSFPLIAVFAFIGSILAITAVYGISRKRRFGTTSLILGGIALSFVLSSGVLLIFSFSRAEQVHRALMWLMGDFSIARYAVLPHMAAFSFVLMGFSMLYHRHLNILSFGADFAKNLGVTGADVRTIFWSASLLAAVSVSLAGVIGFVGLIIPHICRNIFGAGHLRLMPSAALGGGIFLTLCDTAGRTVALPYEIPAGVITGFAGGLFFLLLIGHNSEE